MLRQIGARAFATSFMVGVLLCYCKKNGKIHSKLTMNMVWLLGLELWKRKKDEASQHSLSLIASLVIAVFFVAE